MQVSSKRKESGPVNRILAIWSFGMRSSFGLTPVPEELSVFEALAGGPFAPSSETAWLKGFSHVSDYLAFIQSGNFLDFLKGDAISPGRPNDPVVAAFGWLGFFDPGDGEVRLFRAHERD